MPAHTPHILPDSPLRPDIIHRKAGSGILIKVHSEIESHVFHSQAVSQEQVALIVIYYLAAEVAHEHGFGPTLLSFQRQGGLYLLAGGLKAQPAIEYTAQVVIIIKTRESVLIVTGKHAFDAHIKLSLLILGSQSQVARFLGRHQFLLRYPFTQANAHKAIFPGRKLLIIAVSRAHITEDHHIIRQAVSQRIFIVGKARLIHHQSIESLPRLHQTCPIAPGIAVSCILQSLKIFWRKIKNQGVVLGIKAGKIAMEEAESRQNLCLQIVHKGVPGIVFSCIFKPD